MTTTSSPGDGMTIAAALDGLKRRLLASRPADANDAPAVEAQALLARVLGVERAFLLAHPEQALTADQMAVFSSLGQRLAAGEPLPYLTGRQAFYGLDFEVSPDVLIPRPETELLVELAIKWLRANPARRLAADVGTGSGCIAVTLAVNVPDLRISALDLSPLALAVAQRNARKHGVEERVMFFNADLLKRVQARFDLVCANLPYVPRGALARLDVARHEPALALDGGEDGLDLIRALLADLPYRLNPGGVALLEIEAGQGRAALAAAQNAITYGRATLVPDLAGRDRLLVIET